MERDRRISGEPEETRSKTPNGMEQFPREATIYLVSDGALYRRQTTNEPPAQVLMSSDQTRT